MALSRYRLPYLGFEGLMLVVFVGFGLFALILNLEHYQKVCERTQTHQRVADAQCPANSAPDFRWLYYGPGQHTPAIGGSTVGGSAVAPSSSMTTIDTAPGQGGAVSEDNEEDGPSISTTTTTGGSSFGEGCEGGSSSGGGGGEDE